MQNNINKHTAKMYLIRGKTIFLCFLVFFGISSADIFIKKWIVSSGNIILLANKFLTAT
jgi:hypothetical protein